MSVDLGPLALPATNPAAPVRRLGRGTYSATAVAGVVHVRADHVAMSGLSAHADLVHIPSFAPPLRYELVVTETLPQLANLIIGSAEAVFQSGGPDAKEGHVQIEDADGRHDVPIERLAKGLDLRNLEAVEMPGPDGRGQVLQVSGEAFVPTTDTIVQLKDHVPVGFNPAILLLDLIPRHTGIGGDVFLWKKIEPYSRPVDKGQFKQVTILQGAETAKTIDVRQVVS